MGFKTADFIIDDPRLKQAIKHHQRPMDKRKFEI